MGMFYNNDEIQFYETLALNMEKERVKMGLTQEEMAEALGVSFGAYKKIAHRETYKLTAYTLFRLHELTGKFGKELTGYGRDNCEVLRKFDILSKPQKDFVSSIIDFELNFIRDLPKEMCSDDYITVLILTGDMEDGMIYDSCNFKKVYAKDYIERCAPTKINCGIEVTSNHLHPVYHLGEILLITKEPVRHGDTGVFINKRSGRAYLRKLIQGNEKSILSPICDFGEPFTIDTTSEESMNEWIKYGKVICKMR